ncbi:FAD-dependent oxidoreductase [Croceicoccus bisphenolivorans]|uniref:FAD-dependent oxidoreductase n=1 Tax=Croceicoccus bisphenolivorans TaxID=1783232 RepID=UPI00082DAC6E|nr:FAD-dependent oxidoreductase [Croceicoccus bisphenolivorans]
MTDRQQQPAELPVASRVSRRGFLAAGGVAVAGASTWASAAEASTQASHADPLNGEMRVADIVVVGSGAAATSAAITAAIEGAHVIQLEKAPITGGTSAKSGGGIWIPNNFWLKENGIDDPRTPFLAYCAQYSFPHLFDAASPTFGLDRNSFELIAAFYDNASPMLDWLTKNGALKMGKGIGLPDFYDYGVLDGWNRVPRGRGLFPRRDDGQTGFGAELMRRMTERAAALGVETLTEHEVLGLQADASGAVRGVDVRSPGGTMRFGARRGVIFGTGGFTYNRALLNLHMKEPVFGGCGVPTNTGDFVGMAGAVGAKFGNMASAWRSQIVLEEALQYVTVPSPMWIPPGDSMIMVNRHGHRFVNEKRNYHDRSRAQLAYDANVPEFPNQIAFVIYDQRNAELYAGSHPFPNDPTGSDYVIKAEDWPSLVAAIAARLKELGSATGGISLAPDFGQVLETTVSRFNGFAQTGLDSDFGRGSFPYDIETAGSYAARQPVARWKDTVGPNPALYPIAGEGPYYAIIVGPGTLDTNGGPVIDKHARVLRHDGTPIDGLYGAGNCIASPSHDAYYAAGVTLGLGLTFGFIAARHAMGRG